MTTVLASGVFDLLHYGHIRYLEEAKRRSGEDARLIVVVARDETVMKRKGKRPVIPENQRRALVEALEVVDEALLGYPEMDMSSVLLRIKPDIVAVGYDEEGIKRQLERIKAERGLDLRIEQIGRFGEEALNSSSKIKRKIVEDWRKGL
ncbi:MAG: adenylyltransferase/cytidyltransferase family protein [Candidatus Bathyarchaeia archaeon]